MTTKSLMTALNDVENKIRLKKMELMTLSQKKRVLTEMLRNRVKKEERCKVLGGGKVKGGGGKSGKGGKLKGGGGTKIAKLKTKVEKMKTKVSRGRRFPKKK